MSPNRRIFFNIVATYGRRGMRLCVGCSLAGGCVWRSDEIKIWENEVT